MTGLRILLAMLLALALPPAAAGGAGVSAPHPLAPFIRAELEQTTDGAVAPPGGGPVAPASAVARFYAQRAYHPAWDDGERFGALVAALAGVVHDGLAPDDYRADTLPALRASAATPVEQARVDVLATRMLLLALSHVHEGKLTPEGEQPVWRIDDRAIASDTWLAAVHAAAANGHVADLFAHARPAHPIYGALREGLGRLRAIEAAGGWAPVPAGPTLRPGMQDARVPGLRTRLALAGHEAAPMGVPDVYDEALAVAVTQFQREQYLAPDGAVGRATLAALNRPVEARIGQLRANLERARWLLRELEGDLVLVDIAGYRIAYYRGSQAVWRARVQVGKPYRSTPVLRSRISHFTFNPSWTVPPTILREDVLPKVREDPAYLARNQMRVIDRDGRELDPAWIPWDAPGDVMLRQDPGPGNPLGQVVIRFPNPYAVYLHDTPNRRLFDRDRRASSSGCIRVERPLELVELLFDDPERWDRSAIEAMIATGRTRDVPLPRPVTILILYWTVDVHTSGRIAYKPDIYERDGPLLQALAARRP